MIQLTFLLGLVPPPLGPLPNMLWLPLKGLSRQMAVCALQAEENLSLLAVKALHQAQDIYSSSGKKIYQEMPHWHYGLIDRWAQQLRDISTNVDGYLMVSLIN